MKIVIHPAVDPDRLAALRAVAPGIELVNASAEPEALAAIVGAVGYLGKITPGLLAGADRLRWVQAFTVSLEHYVFPALVDHPCTLTNMRGLFGDVIADQVLGYVLCFARNLHTYVRRQAERRYEPVGGESARVDNAFGPGVVNAMDRGTIFLPDTTMGIVGYGAIGREIGRRARAFGIAVRAVDPQHEAMNSGPDGATVGPMESLPDLLAASDWVVIAAPHTPETASLFDAATIGEMKSSGHLINIGRGAIVVLDDLVSALRSGQIAGAALDVYEFEPLPADHPLWSFSNVILTPHTAGYSPAIAGRHLAVLVDNLGRFARGEPLANVVDKAAWY